MTETLSPQEVLRVYEALERTYGFDPLPPRDTLLIELACARPRMAAYGNTLATLAVFLESLMNFRPFQAHNTATAFACFTLLLGMNNLRLATSQRITLHTWQQWNKEPPDYLAILKWLHLAVEPL